MPAIARTRSGRVQALIRTPWTGATAVALPSAGNAGGAAAAYGAAVSFGPNVSNFRSVAGLLLENDAAATVRDPTELCEFVARCLDRPEYAERLGKNAKHIVVQQQGALQRTTDLLATLLEQDLPTKFQRAA